VSREIAFEFGGRDLEAFVFDELLDAVGDVEVSVFVLVADIPCL
jgi:hypothetical protein